LAINLDNEVKAIAKAKKRTYIYKVADGCDIGADVHIIDDGRTRPVILWLHGGALILGNRNLPDRYRDAYLTGGYTVVSVDYRLAPETKLPAIIENLKDACAWVREEGPRLFNAEPQDIAMVGHSAGAYLTLMSGCAIRPRPQALVSFYGYGDIIGPWYSKPDPFYCSQPPISKEEAYSAIGRGVISATNGSEGRDRFYLYCRQQGIWPREVCGHDPDDELEFFYPFCPIRNVDAGFPPTLLLHGDRDTDVPHEQSVLMQRALSRHAVEYELITVPNGPHGFDFLASNSEFAVITEKVLAFLYKHLRERA